MPSRFGVFGIVLFWLATTGYVGYRDVWPRLFADGPPPLRIDLTDEATQTIPARWTIYRGTQKVGSLTTWMEYAASDDTFWFKSKYNSLELDYEIPRVGSVTLAVPELETAVRVTRAGALREQTMTGKLDAKVGKSSIGTATAKVDAKVEDGMLVGQFRVVPPAFVGKPIDRPLEPVPVPGGQVLNPMMPVNRLRDVQPGKRWVIYPNDPLKDSFAAAFPAFAQQGKGPSSLIAEVASASEMLVVKNKEIECWVIEYRGDDVTAKTWVAVSDGRVLRQEASGFGEKLRFERED